MKLDVIAHTGQNDNKLESAHSVGLAQHDRASY